MDQLFINSVTMALCVVLNCNEGFDFNTSLFYGSTWLMGIVVFLACFKYCEKSNECVTQVVGCGF